MNRLRRLTRLAVLTPFTVLCYLRLLLGALAISAVRGGGWLGPATARYRARCFQAWSRGLLRILGVRTAVSGRPPEGPFFLVCNHLSYLDIAVLGAQLPCVLVSKAEVANWPVLGTLCRAADTIFIDRRNKRDIPRVIERIERVLASGRGVVVFPEGTSTKGAEVLRFRPSLLEAAAAAGIPVSYAALTYRTPPGAPPAHLSVCWWNDMEFAPHLLTLLSLPRIDAGLQFGEGTIIERDRKILAARLQYAVSDRFQPVVRTETA